MEGKFILFVVVASLAQCLAENYGFSEAQAKVYRSLDVNGAEVYSAELTGYNTFYNMIEEHVYEIIGGLNKRDNDLAEVTDVALEKVKNGSDTLLKSIETVSGGACSTSERTEVLSHAYVDYVFAKVSDLFILAKSGEASANNTEMETLRSEIKEHFTQLIGSYYDAIRTCLKSTAPDFDIVIQASQAASTRNSIRAINALINAIKLYGATVEAQSADVFLVATLESLRSQSHEAAMSQVEAIIILLKTLYMQKALGLTGGLSILSANQYSQMVAFHRFREETQTIYGTVTLFMEAIQLGAKYQTMEHLSLTSIARDMAIAKFQAGCIANLVSVSAMHPNATGKTEAARESCFNTGDTVVTLVYEAIEFAWAASVSYADSLEKISDRKETALKLSTAVYPNWFDLLRNNETYDDATEHLVTGHENKAYESLAHYVIAIFDIIFRLAEVSNADVVTDDDFTAIISALNEAITSVNDFTKLVSNAGFVIMEYHNSN